MISKLNSVAGWRGEEHTTFRVRRLVQLVAATVPKTPLIWRKLEVGPKLLAWSRPKP